FFPYGPGGTEAIGTIGMVKDKIWRHGGRSMPQPQGKNTITLSMYYSPVKNRPSPVEKIHNLHRLANMLQKRDASRGDCHDANACALPGPLGNACVNRHGTGGGPYSASTGASTGSSH